MEDILCEETLCEETSSMLKDINLTGTSSTTSQIKILESNSNNVANSEMSILDGTYFEQVSSKSTDIKLVGMCKKCLPNYVEIKGSKNCTSNFVTHLKRKHGNDVFEEYRTYLKRKKISSKKSSSTSGQSSRKSTSSYSQNNFDQDMIKYFVQSMIPLRVVENLYFRKIFENLNIASLGLKIINRRRLGHEIENYYEEQSSIIKQELKNIKYVCTAVDIWSGRKRSFLGLTAHWIDPISLRRVSKALACRRFKGTHSYDKITELLQEIHSEYGLNSSKIVATVTDNGSNFVKAFKRFGVHHKCISEEDSINNSDTDSSDCEMINQDTPLIDTDSDEELIVPNHEILLPSHLRCSSHTLSLCATVDANKILKEQNTQLSIIHQQVLKKCNVLWKSGNRPKSAETIQNVLGYALSKPGETRWNSLYDALKKILNIKEKNATLHKDLGLKNPIRDHEFDYIEEYLSCTKPIAEALDILQGENNIYYGILLPTLLIVRRKLQKLTKKTFVYCTPLAEVYLASVEKRFEDFFNFSTPQAENAVIASLSYPRFKNKWFSCIESIYQTKFKNLFKTIISKEIIPDTNISNNTYNCKQDDFFDFDSDFENDNQCNERSKAEVLTLHFFAEESRELNLLEKYPEIKRIFLKYNTPLPSSASVERLFSYATITNCPKANRLSDQMFEKRVILKNNLTYDKKRK